MFNMLLEAGSGGVTISSALGDATTLFSWVLDTITSNVILCAAFVLGVLVPAGVMVFRRMIHSV